MAGACWTVRVNADRFMVVTDTAIFRGPCSDHTVSRLEKGRAMVVDSTTGRDGSDILTGIELVKFSDRTVPVAKLRGAPHTRSGLSPSG